MKKSTKKGFTLAELLIVIAIIAVLIAIMFPVFGAQLNKARAAAELANVRARYSELVADAMLGEGENLTATDAAGTATVYLSDLKAAKAYDSDTKIIVMSSASAPEKPTETEDVVKNSSAKTNESLYVVVVYKNYFGSFKVDSDVTFGTEKPTT